MVHCTCGRLVLGSIQVNNPMVIDTCRYCFGLYPNSTSINYFLFYDAATTTTTIDSVTSDIERRYSQSTCVVDFIRRDGIIDDESMEY